MAQFEIIMPKMGESIEEATITKWFIKEGDVIEEDDVLLEIATDKVDSEIPSPVAGKVKKIMFKQDETVPVGTVIAIIDLGGEETSEEEVDEQVTPEKKSLKDDEKSGSPEDDSEVAVTAETEDEKEEEEEEDLDDQQKEDKGLSKKSSDRFYSPLVRKIADEEKITRVAERTDVCRKRICSNILRIKNQERRILLYPLKPGRNPNKSVCPIGKLNLK